MSDGAYADISLDTGADFTMQISWTDPNNQPYEVIHPIRMQAKASTSQVVLDLTSYADGEEIPDGVVPTITYSSTNGIIQLYVPRGVTATIPPGTYYYDMFVTYRATIFDVGTSETLTEDRVMKLMYGKLTAEGRVTTNV